MPNRRNPPLSTRTRESVRGLRRSMTDAERLLWMHLRGGRLMGWKFRRQHPVPPFVADFCCIEARLVVEVDGSQHGTATDAVRTRRLQAYGWHLIRFWDHDVLSNTDAVLEAILIAVGDRTLTPTPLPAGEGL